MKNSILFLDCFSGISGDMFVGAMIDLGVDKDYIIDNLSTLQLKNYKIEIKKKNINGIYATDFNVIVEKFDNEKHRNIFDIKEIIYNSSLSSEVKNIAYNIFEILAKAESKIHNTNLENIHFHEIGALDSIVDIVSASLCINYFEIENAYNSRVNLGTGFVNTMHGVLPVPAPATLEILKDIECNFSDIKTELTTPTGAAILKYLVKEAKKIPDFKIKYVGYGSGKKVLEIPNILRIILGEMDIVGSKLYILETNIDNMNPEFYSYLFPKIFEAGALDVFVSPILMKKNRPANMLSVLCFENNLHNIEKIIFSETTTIGIRRYPIERTELNRKIEKLETKYGIVNIKITYYNNEIINISPEYEDCEKIAKTVNIPLKKIYEEIKIFAYKELVK